MLTVDCSHKFVKWVGWDKQQCSWEVADGAELNPEELVGEEITVVTHKSGTTHAMINRRISGSTYLVTSDDDSIDDSEYDLLLPTCVRWSSWRLSDCSEYDASKSSESEGGESEQEVSGSESE